MLVLTATTLPASQTDDRIEAAAKSSYVFKNFLKDDPRPNLNRRPLPL